MSGTREVTDTILYFIEDLTSLWLDYWFLKDKVPIFYFCYIFRNAQNNTGHTRCGLLVLNRQENFEAEHKSANKII